MGLKDILFSRVDFIFLQHMDLSHSNAILDVFLDSGDGNLVKWEYKF